MWAHFREQDRPISGFGSNPFGHGPFGQYDWSKQVLFRDLPEVDRRIDASSGGGRLELFTDALRPTFDELLRFVRRFGDLRDADRVRTQFQGRLSVNVLDAVSSPTGQTIDARLEDLDDDPFSPLGKASIGWILKDGAGREYTVNAVHKLRDVGPTVELVGGADLPISAVRSGTVLTGSVKFTKGSATVTGSGTLFLTQVATMPVIPGNYIAPQVGGFASKVQSILDNVTLTLTEPYQGETTRAVIGVVTLAERGASVIRPPALIQLLGQDFGLDVDTHEAESFQRSSVHDIVQWLDLKSAQKSYDIIAKIAGYRAIAFALWRVDPVPSALPLNEVFETPFGSGKFYTTIDPLRPRFDEIVADAIPLDLFCWETPNWTTDGIVPPPGPLPDGTSVEDAIGSYTQGMTIISTEDRSTDPSLSAGRWRMRVGPSVMDTVVGIGFWYAGFPAIPGVKHFLETLPQEQATGLTGTLTFTDGSATVAGIGTSFLAEVAIGQYISSGLGFTRGRVLAVVDNVTITLDAPYAGPTTSPGAGFIVGEWLFELLAGEAPVFGATVNVDYQCRIAPSCDYCRASVIRVEVTPVEVFSDPDSLLDGVLQRLAAKILGVIPAHVRVTDIVHIVGPAQAIVGISVQAAIARTATAAASIGFYYDIIPADVIPVDPSHLSASGSVSTTP